MGHTARAGGGPRLLDGGWEMRSKQRWLAFAAAALGFGLTGCQTWVGGMTLPSPRYLEHYPQYFPPDPSFPLPRELATQTDPAGAGGAVGVPGAGPALVPPAAPVPVAPGGFLPPGGGGPGNPGGPAGVLPPR
ncbi:MAG: hypothetical protein JWO38_6090 [Gemmataceae bacterium]|nr:hypothetical protein [Gemmataceae bacterium]